MTFNESYLDDEQPMTEAERNEYCSSIASIFPRIEKDIKRFLFKQIMFNSNLSATWEEVLTGRGVFAGQEMLLDYWRSVNQEYLDRVSQKEFEKNSPLGEI